MSKKHIISTRPTHAAVDLMVRLCPSLRSGLRLPSTLSEVEGLGKWMRKYFIVIFVCGLVISASLVSKSEEIGKKSEDTPRLQNLIAHAGGGIENLSFVNSLEALNLSYSRGFRFIELDFEWTSDGHLVLIHDWKNAVSQFFNVPERRYSLKEYNSLRMINGMTNLSLEDLAEWMKQHPDVFIVTDVKHDSVRALTRIKERFPELVKNFIPQIYYFYEYSPVKELGYKHIILTLYVAVYSDEAVLKFAKNYPLLAITMPVSRALTDLPQKLRKLNIVTYAHTVNRAPLQHRLYTNGVFGVYTDFLVPLYENQK